MTGPNQPTEPTPVQPGVPAQPGAPIQPTDPAQPVAPTWFDTTTQSPPPPVAHEVPVAAVSTISTPRTSARKRGVVDVVLVVAAIFALGGIGFAAGRITAPATTASVAGAGRAGNGTFPGGGEFGAGGGNRGAGNGFGFGGGAAGGGISISGTVTAVAADSLTLKLASGQSITIALDTTTVYHSQAAATVSDVTTGSTVQVQLTRGPGATGGGTGGLNLGAASSVTVIPK
jgi:hypothetical protein